jgi:hypothetical protein
MGRAEARRAWDLHQDGPTRELCFRADETLSVLILERADVAAAEAALASLAMVAAGLIRFEVLPLRAYPGFARLFGPISDRAYFRLVTHGSAVTGPGM